MARPRKASDEEVFAAAHRAMSHRGPAELTLADIAGEAGLTAGALVQRFGSKAALLRLLARKSADVMKAGLEEIAARHSSPLASVRAYAACMAKMGSSASALAHHLEWLQLDLSDPGMHRALVIQARNTRAWFQERLRAAVRAGEVHEDTDPACLARSVEVAISGSLLTWAFSRGGSCAEFVSGSLEAVLMPHLTRVRRRGPGRPDPSTRHARTPDRRDRGRRNRAEGLQGKPSR